MTGQSPKPMHVVDRILAVFAGVLRCCVCGKGCFYTVSVYDRHEPVKTGSQIAMNMLVLRYATGKFNICV